MFSFRYIVPIFLSLVAIPISNGNWVYANCSKLFRSSVAAMLRARPGAVEAYQVFEDQYRKVQDHAKTLSFSRWVAVKDGRVIVKTNPRWLRDNVVVEITDTFRGTPLKFAGFLQIREGGWAKLLGKKRHLLFIETVEGLESVEILANGVVTNHRTYHHLIEGRHFAVTFDHLFWVNGTSLFASPITLERKVFDPLSRNYGDETEATFPRTEKVWNNKRFITGVDVERVEDSYAQISGVERIIHYTALNVKTPGGTREFTLLDIESLLKQAFSDR